MSKVRPPQCRSENPWFVASRESCMSYIKSCADRPGRKPEIGFGIMSAQVRRICFVMTLLHTRYIKANTVIGRVADALSALYVLATGNTVAFISQSGNPVQTDFWSVNIKSATQLSGSCLSSSAAQPQHPLAVISGKDLANSILPIWKMGLPDVNLCWSGDLLF